MKMQSSARSFWKTILACTTLSAVLPGLLLAEADDHSLNAPAEPDASAGAQVAAQSPAVAPSAAGTNTGAAPICSEYGADGLRMNFHGAPLDLVSSGTGSGARQGP